VRSLTEGLDLDAKESQRLAQLQATMTLDGARGELGQMLYTRHCANCHQLRGLGTVVGPQLDGAAARSVERLLEDIVTPDRNVDHAFRTTTILLDDGRSVAGLVTSETDSQITLADPTGKLITVDAAAIEQRRESGRSLMPANLAEILSQEELRDLIQFVKGG
jgi:putative heme-binding domain-containing protein